MSQMRAHQPAVAPETFGEAHSRDQLLPCILSPVQWRGITVLPSVFETQPPLRHYAAIADIFASSTGACNALPHLSGASDTKSALRRRAVQGCWAGGTCRGVFRIDLHPGLEASQCVPPGLLRAPSSS